MRITFGGQVFSYETEGASSGQPVIFLHGWGMSVESFRAVARYFDKRYRLFLLDLPGFGQATLSGVASPVPDLAALVRQFGQALQLDEVILVAHGLSGRIMVCAAARFGSWVKRLIVIDTPGPKQDRHLKKVLRRLDHETPWATWPIVFEMRQNAKKTLMNLVGTHDFEMANLMRQALKTLASYDPMPAARLVNCATHLVWGSKDAPEHLKEARFFYKTLPRVRASLLPGVGHLDASIAPDAFARAVLSVLS